MRPGRQQEDGQGAGFTGRAGGGGLNRTLAISITTELEVLGIGVTAGIAKVSKDVERGLLIRSVSASAIVICIPNVALECARARILDSFVLPGE